MTYNEWRDELKSNLLSVSEAERRRVLDYYAEAYADRRDAGFTEREIIEDFGAPYDAAQRILSENTDNYYDEPPKRGKDERKKRRNDDYFDEPPKRERREEYYEPPCRKEIHERRREDYTWVFVLLCVVFAIPLFGLVMTMVGITIGICVAPFGLLIGGIATIGAGIGEMFTNLTNGAATLGIGLIIFGASLMLMPLCLKLVKIMWTLFTRFFAWAKRLFSGKEAV